MVKHGNGAMENKSYHVFSADIFKFINKDSKIFDNNFLNTTFRQHRQIMKLLPSADLLNQKTIDLFSQYGIRKDLMTFYQRPFCYNKKAHIDISLDNSCHWYSLNIIVYGQGKMMWFNPSFKKDIFGHKNDSNILYIDFEDYTVLGNPIDIWSSGKIALVKTGIPHHTHNDDSVERLVVSIRWDPIFTWDSTIELINNFIHQN
jgi:hypothetical protein